ncbi:Uncharacterised protein [Vibrio cholerae]|nr:Uncharacterised protein [Vibrio cholerae]
MDVYGAELCGSRDCQSFAIFPELAIASISWIV